MKWNELKRLSVSDLQGLLRSRFSRLTISVSTLVLLCLCLSITSFALGYAVFEVRDNTFRTGEIKIDLNGGNAIISADEYEFEPGMTVEKPFYIRNNGSWAVYYKLYFAQVSGDLGDVLDVTISDAAGKALYTGKLSQLNIETAPAVENELERGDTHWLSARFHFPEESGNACQNRSVTFELSAVAVQTKNNPDKEFN